VPSDTRLTSRFMRDMTEDDAPEPDVIYDYDEQDAADDVYQQALDERGRED